MSLIRYQLKIIGILQQLEEISPAAITIEHHYGYTYDDHRNRRKSSTSLNLFLNFSYGNDIFVNFWCEKN